MPPTKRGIFLLSVFLGIFIFPVLTAHESGLEENNCCWDRFSEDEQVERPIFENKLPTNLNKVRYSGNGSCMPYARYRSGFPIYGSAGTILTRLPEGLATATQPQIGDVVVTTEGPGHVAVVESVSDSSVRISEQNYLGHYIISVREIPMGSPVIVSYIRKVGL